MSITTRIPELPNPLFFTLSSHTHTVKRRMVGSSASIVISSAPSSFPANSSSSNYLIISNLYSVASPSILGVSRILKSNSKIPIWIHNSSPQSRIGCPKAAIFNKSTPSDGSDADQFLENNSIADFMRFDNSSGNAQLQTAVVSYRKKFPWSILRPFLQVDLVSTIHIADKEYFDVLQKELEPYDCVLYEMVTSRESLDNRRQLVATKKLKRSSRPSGFNILGCIQRQMARILTLDFQLDCLDYQADNWFHADLDFETFKLLQLEKGESIFTFARDMTIRSTKALVKTASIPEELGPWRSKLLWASRALPMPLVGILIIGGLCADAGSPATDYPEVEALSMLDFGAAMKVFLAKRLTSEFTQATADVEEKSVIIGERNRAATEALQRAIDEGHNKIAILYGGGHMPDLGRRLRKEFDLFPSGVQWVTAWSITSRNVTSSSLPFLTKMAEATGWPLNRYQTMALLIFSSFLALDLCFWELFFGTSLNWLSDIGSQIVDYVDSSR